jgi:hypothetical protein
MWLGLPLEKKISQIFGGFKKLLYVGVICKNQGSR